MIDTPHLDALAALVGDRHLLVDPADKARYEIGARYDEGRAAAVVRPATTAEVSAVVAYAVAHGLTLVPQGGNTGLVGAATPDISGTQLVLSLDRLNRRPVVDPTNRTVEVVERAIATSLPGVLAKEPSLIGKTTATGTPMRPAILAAAAVPFVVPGRDDPLRVLVVGGSQGARVMSDIVPEAIEQLEAALRRRLVLTQQVRGEDMVRVRAVYDRLGINAELAPFFADLPARLASSHIIVSRSGAGTVAELGAIGRPSILVPLPGALDQDQFANAGVLADAGGAIRIVQADFTPERLAAELSALADDPARLAAMAAAARTVGRLDAAERLADLLVKVAGI